METLKRLLANHFLTTRNAYQRDVVAARMAIQRRLQNV